jgi:hypothetical protein
MNIHRHNSSWLAVVLTLALLCLGGCAGLPKYADALQLEERWASYDRALQSLDTVSSSSTTKFVALEARQQAAFVKAACASADGGTNESCQARVGERLATYYSDTEPATLATLPALLVGLSYQAAVCTIDDSGLLPGAVQLAMKLSQKLDHAQLQRSRVASAENLRAFHGLGFLGRNSRKQEDEQLLLRAEADSAAEDVRTSVLLLAALEGYARQCGKKRLREAVASELQTVIGFVSAQDPTIAVSYTLLEAARELPQAFKVDFATLAAAHQQVSLRTAARYALGDKVLTWQTGGPSAGRQLGPEIAELTDFLYSDAGNSDHIANLLHRSHWANVLQISSGDPLAASLANGARALSANFLSTARTKNSCAASSLLTLSRAMQLVDQGGTGKARDSEIASLITRAKSMRETLAGCDRPPDYASCSTAPKGSREYFRMATSSLLGAVDKEVIDLEQVIGSLSQADIQTRRNVITAQFIASLNLLLRSVDSKSACYL